MNIFTRNFIIIFSSQKIYFDLIIAALIKIKEDPFVPCFFFLHTKISALFVRRIFLPVYLFFSFNAASMKPWKRGCGLFGRLLNSGCACVASK